MEEIHLRKKDRDLIAIPVEGLGYVPDVDFGGGSFRETEIGDENLQGREWGQLTSRVDKGPEYSTNINKIYGNDREKPSPRGRDFRTRAVALA